MTTSQLGYGASVDLRTVGQEVARKLRRKLPLAALEQMLGRVIVAGWARVEPAPPLPKPLSAAFSDNVQRTMNLIMPLKDRSAVGRAKLMKLFMDNGDLILSGLRNVGTVHSARFDILDGKLCLFSVYDGDTAGYIRDFIVSVGTFFNGLMAFVEDPPPLPVEHHVDEFVDWVTARDLVQLPEDITELCPDLEYLPRRLTVLLHDFPDLQIFSYSQYPSCTAAQIREQIHLGW
ncbi:MAG: hypothetical protein AB1679_07115 [Actinomycetota bacterium]|jgi:hypothetical protein